MTDRLIRAITADGMVKATAVTTRELTERARQIHKTLPVVTAALGRTLAAASMMGNALKSEGASLSIQVRGGGPVGAIVAISDSEGNVRGYAEHPENRHCIGCLFLPLACNAAHSIYASPQISSEPYL